MLDKTELEPLYREILSFRPRSQDERVMGVLSAAIDLLAEKGVDEVTFESVGKRAKMARSHVVYYFKSRDELIEAAIRFVAFSAQRIIASHLLEIGTSEALLDNYTDANFKWLGQYPKHATVMLLLYYESSFKKPRRAFNSEIRRVGRKRLEAIFRLDPALSKISPAKRERLSSTVQALITGNLVAAFTTNGSKLERLKKETQEAVRDLVTFHKDSK